MQGERNWKGKKEVELLTEECRTLAKEKGKLSGEGGILVDRKGI